MGSNNPLISVIIPTYNHPKYFVTSISYSPFLIREEDGGKQL